MTQDKVQKDATITKADTNKSRLGSTGLYRQYVAV